MRPTIANANILRFRNELRPEGVANVAGLLEPIVSQVKNSLNEATRVSPSGSNVVETPEYYRNLPSTNIPVGDFLVGNADRALLDVSQHRPPDPYDVIDLGLLGVDAFFPARGAVKLTGKALTSPFAKDIYANIPDAVNRLNQRFTGVDLQPDIMMGEKSLLWNKRGGDSDKFLEMEKQGFQSSSNPEATNTKTTAWQQTGTGRQPWDKKLRQELDDSQSFLDTDKLPKFNEEQMQKYNAYLMGYKDKSLLPDNLKNVSKNKFKQYANLKLLTDIGQQNAVPLKDVLHYRDLFEAYPQLNEGTKITTIPMIGERRVGGFFDSNTNTVFVNTNSLKSIDPKEIVLHELQHKVQDIEGFDRGTYGALSYTDVLKSINRVKKENPDNKKIISLVDDVYNKFTDEKYGEYYLQPEFPYRTKSGEIEARLVGRRRDMPADERRKVYPYRFNRVASEWRPDENIMMDYPVDLGWSSADTGMFAGDKSASKSFSYIKSTPKNIDSRVGTRFEKEYVGDLVKPKTITGKELEGATIVTKPSDVTSRGEKIKSISDEFFEQQPPTTEGGFDFALSKKNIAEGKYYGSGLEQVDTDTRRMIQAFRENKAQGGSGRMMFTPSTMGTYSESFSTMPFENLMPILAKAKPEAIAKVNNEIRQIYPEFSGLNTPAGTAEILNHGNLRKLAMERLRTKSAQENLGYNAEDLYNAVRSERFVGVGKNMIGDTLVEMDTALLQRADDMLNDAGITNLSQSKEARKARSPEQNAVLDEVYAMFRKDMGDSHRTYKVANTGATANRFTLDSNLPLIEVAGDDMINDLMRGKVDYSIDPNKTYSNKVTPDEAQNIIHTGHKNVGLFIDPARAKRIDDARKSGQFDRKVTSIMDDVIYNFPDNRSMSKVYPLDPEIKSYKDIPNKDWLEHKRDRARLRGFGDVGSHIGSAITGGFQDNVVVPTKVLREIQGLNLEQQNVRPDSLEYLKDYMSKNKHLPKWYSGYDIYKTGYHGGVGRNLPLGVEGVREDVPFIQVDQYGQPFVNEGNHRIMTADKLGWENLPIELRYFEGGNIERGLLSPELIKEYNRTGNPNIFDEELQKYIEKVKTNRLIADYYLKKSRKK